MSLLSDFCAEYPSAQFLRCRPDKRPIDTAAGKPPQEWPRPTVTEMEQHTDAGGKLGLVPASINCCVIDIDRGGKKTLAELTSGLCIDDIEYRDVPTARADGLHVYMASEGYIPNIVWRDGEVRGSVGYVVVHALEQVLYSLAELDGSKGVTEAYLRELLPQGGESDVGDCVEGNRNNWLARSAYIAGLQDNEGKLLEALTTARNAGLQEEEAKELAVRAFSQGRGEYIRKHVIDGAPRKSAPAILRKPTGIQTPPAAALHKIVPPRQRISLIGGAPGSGKTTIAYAAMAELLRSGCKGLVITDDMTEYEVNYKAFEMGWEESGWMLLDLCADQEGLASPTAETVEEAITIAEAAMGSLDVIIIDLVLGFLDLVANAFLPQGEDLDEFARRHALRGCDYLNKLAWRHTAAIVGIMHQVKNTDTRNALPGHVMWQGRAHSAFLVYSAATARSLDKVTQARLAAAGPQARLVVTLKNRSASDFPTYLVKGNQTGVSFSVLED